MLGLSYCAVEKFYFALLSLVLEEQIFQRKVRWTQKYFFVKFYSPRFSQKEKTGGCLCFPDLKFKFGIKGRNNGKQEREILGAFIQLTYLWLCQAFAPVKNTEEMWASVQTVAFLSRHEELMAVRWLNSDHTAIKPYVDLTTVHLEENNRPSLCILVQLCGSNHTICFSSKDVMWVHA